MLTYSQRKSFNRAGAKAIDARIAEAQAELAAEAETERKARALLREQRSATEPYTAEQVKPATHVRTSTGWHKVVRVSDKSVTVETGYSWTDRIPLDRIERILTVP